VGAVGKAMRNAIDVHTHGRCVHTFALRPAIGMSAATAALWKANASAATTIKLVPNRRKRSHKSIICDQVNT
jgi:hypothetical protein